MALCTVSGHLLHSKLSLGIQISLSLFCLVFSQMLYFFQYREAQLIGDFNGWDGSNHQMERNQFGVWSIKIPDAGGSPAIPHNSRVKFKFRLSDGVWVDRIPAWIKYATVDPTKFAAPYDGVYWDPPLLERSHCYTLTCYLQ